MYEALAGRPPFGEGTPIALAIRIRDGRYEPLRQVVRKLDPVFARTVARAMSKDPMARYASAEDMATALTSRPAGKASGETTAIVERPSDDTAILEPIPVAAEPEPVSEPTAAAPNRPGRRRTIGLVVAAVVLAIAIGVVLALTVGGGTTEAPSVPTTVSGAPVPAPLQDALDRLQESIRP
jgi:serine/threonine-protein kinase